MYGSEVTEIILVDVVKGNGRLINSGHVYAALIVVDTIIAYVHRFTGFRIDAPAAVVVNPVGQNPGSADGAVSLQTFDGAVPDAMSCILAVAIYMIVPDQRIDGCAGRPGIADGDLQAQDAKIWRSAPEN